MGIPEPAVEVPEGSAKKGAKLFKAKCAQCHSFEAGGSNKQGPALWGVMGRQAGKESFGYSSAMADSGIVWSPQHFYQFLINPKKYVVGTKMVFAGLKKDAERADLIAYLGTGSK
jgi:cytochrome c